MSKFIAALIAVLVLILAGGLVYLMTADIPAPSQSVTKTIDNDRFPA